MRSLWARAEVYRIELQGRGLHAEAESGYCGGHTAATRVPTDSLETGTPRIHCPLDFGEEVEAVRNTLVVSPQTRSMTRRHERRRMPRWSALFSTFSCRCTDHWGAEYARKRAGSCQRGHGRPAMPCIDLTGSRIDRGPA
jgi:hypothetical protein